MLLPSFNAEASLYAPRRKYHSTFQAGHALSNVVLPQDCSANCWLAYGLCVLGAGGNPLAVIACYGGFLFCEANCPGPGGGNGGPPQCCPPGTTCRCGGECVNLRGGGQRCTGQCLGPRGSCN